MVRTTENPETLKGWREIAAFFGEPISVVKRWASTGMPVHRQGNLITATADDLNAWLAKESGKPVHVAEPDTDLLGELKRGLSYVRGKQQRKTHRK